MNQPDAISKPPPTGAPTISYESSAPSDSRPKMALVVGPGAQPRGELHILLRRRLRLIGVFVSGIYAYFAVVSAVSIALNLDVFVEGWFYYPVFWLVSLGSAVLTAIVWRKAALSLGQVRAIELALFGLVLADPAWSLFCDLFIARSMIQFRDYSPTTVDREGLHLLFGGYWSLRFFVIIVGYSTLIPNTWQRCAVVVGVAALLPLSLGAGAGFLEGVAVPVYLQFFLLPMGMFLAMAVVIAVYGSHRIEVLRQEAFAARKLGQYVLKERLGSGGMGEVYLAEHLLLRRPCALKVIHPERAGDPQLLRRFEREVQVTATLTHPNTVQIFDYGHAEDGTFYYVMEYLPGLSLQELVRRHGPQPPERVVHILRQVCGALREAHGIGLIHRDIKPGNIILCERGGVPDVAKLLDFGLVRALPSPALQVQASQLTQEGTITGTPAYMSPEQAAGRELDARSDIYSLGAVGYFLLTGQPPFVRDTPIEVLVAHMRERVVPPDQLRPEIPGDVQAVVLRSLEKEAGKRFAVAADLEAALAACRCAAGSRSSEIVPL